MKSMADPSFSTCSVQADVRELFEKIWRELRGREKAAPNADLARTKVWLECNGELADLEAVCSVGIRQPVPGVEMVEFVCPRCRQSHESLRFR
jgi:hypothetical protein